MVNGLSRADRVEKPYGQRENEVMVESLAPISTRVLTQERRARGCAAALKPGAGERLSACGWAALSRPGERRTELNECRSAPRQRRRRLCRYSAKLAAAGLVSVNGGVARPRLKRELSAARDPARPPLEPNELHIWTRGGFMLIALTYTESQLHRPTLFLAALARQLRPGSPPTWPSPGGSFRQFPDALPLMPDCSAMLEPPAGPIGTVAANTWQVAGACCCWAMPPCHRSLSRPGMKPHSKDCVAIDALAWRAAAKCRRCLSGASG